MSRLQVGGLALSLKDGLVGQLTEYLGDILLTDNSMMFDSWVIEFSDFATCEKTGDKTKVLIEESKYLVPLGDKQGRDEIMREKELEHSK